MTYHPFEFTSVKHPEKRKETGGVFCSVIFFFLFNLVDMNLRRNFEKSITSVCCFQKYI